VSDLLKKIGSDDGVMTHPEPGLRRQVMSSSAAMTLVRHRMEEGWVGLRHSHPHEQLVFVISGAIRLVVDTTPFELRAGDSVMVPGGVEHEASASEVSEVLDVFTPERTEYL